MPYDDIQRFHDHTRSISNPLLVHAMLEGKGLVEISGLSTFNKSFHSRRTVFLIRLWLDHGFYVNRTIHDNDEGKAYLGFKYSFFIHIKIKGS